MKNEQKIYAAAGALALVLGGLYFVQKSDKDELFASGRAWGLKVVRRRED